MKCKKTIRAILVAVLLVGSTGLGSTILAKEEGTASLQENSTVSSTTQDKMVVKDGKVMQDGKAVKVKKAKEKHDTDGVGYYSGAGIQAYNVHNSYEDFRLGSLYNAYIISPILGNHKKLPGSVSTLKGATVYNTFWEEAGVLGVVTINGKKGLLSTDGSILVEPKYKDIDAQYGTSNIEGIIDKKTREVIFVRPNMGQKEYMSDVVDLNEFEVPAKAPIFISDTYKAIEVKRKIGFQDSQGVVVIEPQFKALVANFSEGRAFVKNKEGKVVAIDEQGRELFKAPSSDVLGYDHGLAEYRRKVGGFNFGSLLGFVTGSIGGGFGYNGYGLGGFTFDGVKRGYINLDGQIVIDSKNDKVWPMTEFGTFIENDGKISFVNREGKVVIQPGNYKVGDLDQIYGFASLKNSETDLWGIKSVVTGDEVIPFQYDSIEFSGYKRLIITKGPVKNLINMDTGKPIFVTDKETTIQPFSFGKFTWVHKGSEGYRIINREGKVVYEDKEGIIEEAKPFEHGYSAVKIKGKWGVMTAEGKILVQPMYDRIEIL